MKKAREYEELLELFPMFVFTLWHFENTNCLLYDKFSEALLFC